MAEQLRRDVAVFIDFENIYVSVRDKLDANPNFEIIMDHCNELGRVILSRAYADWYRYPRITSALYANNIEPMYVPTYYYDKGAGRTGGPIKNSVDMNLCIDAMRTLFTMPGLSTFVLITGDRDFIPLVNSIRQQGKDVIIIGVGGAASSHLAQSADEFIFYEQLVGKAEATAPKVDIRRPLDSDDFERPALERERISVARTKPERKESSALNEDEAFELLIKVVLEARSRRMVTGIGSLKTLMRELSNGKFRESVIRDGNGRAIDKFKDFITEAARRGKIIISTEGVVNEVFLPGEDPKALSQFANGDTSTDRRDDDTSPAPALAPERISATPSQAPSTGDKSRRRRRRGDRTPDRVSASKGDVGTKAESTPVDAELSIPTSQPVAPMRAESTSPRDAADDDSGESTLIATPFSEEERRSVRDIVAASERPMSFQQIYDTLRGSRNRGGDGTIPRTNEDLRSLVKLSINAGELQRIGRGNRVSYRIAGLASSTPQTGEDQAPVVVTDNSAARTAAVPQMIPTPQEHGDDELALPTATPTQNGRRRGKPVAPATAAVELAPPVEQKRRGPKPKSAPIAAQPTSTAAPTAPARPAALKTANDSKKHSDTSAPSNTKKPNGRSAPRPAPTTPVTPPAVAPSPTQAAKPRRRKQTPEA
jgi:uncharacterized protein (TIGR00288 family)